jgi:hypothetical protein
MGRLFGEIFSLCKNPDEVTRFDGMDYGVGLHVLHLPHHTPILSTLSATELTLETLEEGEV